MSFLSNLFGGSQFSPIQEIQDHLKAGAILLDVRTEQEFAGGSVAGALNIPVQILEQFINDIKKHQKPVVVFCRSGARASSAMSILNRAGLTSVNAGGLSDMQQLV